jgi:hypothetical protein
METKPKQRVAKNAPGDFYVVDGYCMRCCVPHDVAPELMNDQSEEFWQCYFRRQPATRGEVDKAIEAICISDMHALRYGGKDPSIIRKLHERGRSNCCDHPLPPENEK